MPKHGGIHHRINDQTKSEEFLIPEFGFEDIHIPKYLAEKTSKGYKVVPTLTKTGKLTHRKNMSAVNLIPEDDIFESYCSGSKLQQLQLKDFVKSQRNYLLSLVHAFDNIQQEIDTKVAAAKKVSKKKKPTKKDKDAAATKLQKFLKKKQLEKMSKEILDRPLTDEEIAKYYPDIASMANIADID
jgi:tRNA/tmRNA/rRNA uracil-C5-methylase (TrmA/RlmC/RlmD family)